jgi:hypothetical protein
LHIAVKVSRLDRVPFTGLHSGPFSIKCQIVRQSIEKLIFFSRKMAPLQCIARAIYHYLVLEKNENCTATDVTIFQIFSPQNLEKKNWRFDSKV